MAKGRAENLSGGGGLGRAKGTPQPSGLFKSMRAVWKAGSAHRHADPELQALAEWMANKPSEYFKQLRELETEYRKELAAFHRRRLDALAAANERERVSGSKPASVNAVVLEELEVSVKELAERLLAEWSVDGPRVAG